uniref:Chitin-binding type-2 domain-containing protein n=1 Tax=Anopheles funestus TaxID=62324 RepID=A0A182RBN3_ANOFN
MVPYQLKFVCCFFTALLTLTSSQHPAQQGCPEATRPHTVRCDQYFRCALLPSKRAVWITTQCKKGLVYRHNLSGCVVPDNDWECDLSTEFVRQQSEKNIYGIDNPHQQAFPPSRTPSVTMPNFQPKLTDSKRETQYQLPSIAGDDRRGILIRVDQELNNRTRIRSAETLAEEPDTAATGDDSLERVTEDADTNVLTADNGTIVKPYLPQSFQQTLERDAFANNEQPAPKPLTHLGTSQTVNPPGGVEFPTQGGGPSHKTKLPLPPNGKIHPEHLTQIINQQKQLNRIATQMKQRVDPIGAPGGFSAFTNNMIFSRNPIVLNDYLHNVAAQKQQSYGAEGDKMFKGKEPYVSEDIIKSILQISQQMIANQQKTTAVGTKPVQESSLLKPIYLPISVGSSSSADAGSAAMEYGVPAKPKITTTFNTKPIGISFTNPYSLSHTAVYDNLRQQPLNESTYYNSYLPTLYDIYGNRFVPKDQYVQMMSQNYPQYNTYLGAGPSRPLLQPIPTYPSVVSPYVSPPQGPVISEPSFVYSHHTASPSLLQLQNNVANGYSVTSNAIDRFEPLDFADSNESDGNDSSDSDPTFLSGETSNELDPMDGNDPNVSLKQQFYALGETALDYSQYKDSIMPLLDAHPSDVRISVVTCTLGSREPNKTDCFKYFVCNPHNGAFQSFTCPSFTAFNKETRLCDTASYHACKDQQMPTTTPVSVIRYKGPTGQSNVHLMKNDLLTAQKYVELMRQEANKLLTRNNAPLPAEQTIVLPALDTVNATIFHTVKPSVKMRRKSSSRLPAKIATSTSTTTTTTTTTNAPKTKRSKTTRKGPRCRAEGRIANPLDHHSYYVCHRKSQKKFVKMKMTCPSGLKYCATSQYCSAHC